MKAVFTILVFLIFGNIINGQFVEKIEDSNALLFSLIDHKDTINFIKLDSNFTKKKPVLLILQGSLPIPLVVNYKEGIHLTSFPFNLKENYIYRYHIVVISMPSIPAIVNSTEISSNGVLAKVPKSYNQLNFLETYVNRTHKVIAYLKKQNWVDENKFTLFGHSQGSYVAIKVAGSNSQIEKIGISACSPFGRFEQYISKIRFAEHAGEISSTEAQSQIEEYYERWKYIVNNRHDDTQERGDTFKATFSFSENFIDDMLALRIPLYITYGTKDLGALGCDYIPLEMERAGKKDYFIKAYPGLGHNFEEIDDQGNSDYDRMYWDKAFQDFMEWTKENG